MLCLHCQDQLCPLLGNPPVMLTGEFNPKSHMEATPFGYELATSWTEITSCARAGCPLGAFLVEKFMEDDDVLNANSNVTFSVSFPGRFQRSLRGEIGSVHFKVHKEKNVENLTEEDLIDEDLSDEDENEEAFKIEVFTDPEDPLSPYIFGRPIAKELESQECLDLARGWISRCTGGEHRSCAPAEEYFYPLRLLSVAPDDTGGPDFVRLYLSTSGQKGHYLALSYCWGNAQNFITTTENISSKLDRILLRDMPRTFQDAVYITRELGYHYIWIDALCIIQNSDSDKAEQISRMQDIYRNATLTISASRSSDCHDSFLGPVHIDAEQVPEVVSRKIPYRTLEGIVGSVQLRKQTTYDSSTQQIHKRCWTYQEHFLSRRILSFGDQISWRCAGGEDMNFGVPGNDISILSMPKSVLASNDDILWDTIKVFIEAVYRFNTDEGKAVLEIARYIMMGKRMMKKKESGKQKKVDKIDVWADYDFVDMVDAFTKYFHSPDIRLWLASTETRNAVQRVIAERDLSGIIQIFNPILIKICELGLNSLSFLKEDKELYVALAEGIAQNDILGILQGLLTSGLNLHDSFPDLFSSVEEKVGIKLPRLKPGEKANVQELIPTLVEIVMRAHEIGNQERQWEDHWFAIVEQYSQRSLSNPTDRLAALSGIATDFSQISKGTYLAGLWDKNLSRGLLWRQEKKLHSSRWPQLSLDKEWANLQPSLRPYVAPSWSWAAAEQAVMYPKFNQKFSPYFELLRFEVSPVVSEKVFGQIAEGFIEIRGLLRKVDQTWFTTSFIGSKETYPDPDTKLAYLLENGPDPWDYTTHWFWLLEISHSGYYFFSGIDSQGLVLEKVEDEVFKRVGVYKKTIPVAMLKLFNDRNFEVKTVKII